MLVLRMVSGLVARAWGVVRPTARRFSPQPAFQCYPPDKIERMWSEKKHADRLRSGAAWHAKAARKAVVDLDGEGVLEHMRHFRRYSSAEMTSYSYHPGTCGACGATAAGKDMVSHLTLHGRRLVCIPCSGHRDRPMWTASGSVHGRAIAAIPVEEMGDGHLVNAAAMVMLRLRSGCVSDDRIRMCGHVLEECCRRGIIAFPIIRIPGKQT